MANLLTTLARMNRTTAFLGVLAVALVGLFVPGVLGAAILYVVVGALAWLMSLTWAVTPPALRVARLAILVIVAVAATIKIA